MLNIPHVPAVPIPENIARLLRHLREDSVKPIVDRDYPRGVVLGDRQYYEAALQPHVVPLQPQYFPRRMPVVRTSISTP